MTDEIVDKSGKHRLLMQRIPAESPPGGPSGYKFGSLVWRTKEGDDWKERVVITGDAFQSGTDRQRWIDELHSFDPATGTAIIKVAEGDAPTDAMQVSIVYSWREWNLLTNGQVRLIRICKDPFERY